MRMHKTVSVSPSILWWAAGIVLGVWFLYTIRDVVLLFFLSFLFAAAMEPPIRRLVKKGCSRALAATLIFVAFIIVVSGLFSFLVPTIIQETRGFVRDLPVYSQEIFGSADFFKETSQQFLVWFEGDWTFGIPDRLFSTTLGAFGVLISGVAVISMAFYLSLYERGMEKLLRNIVPEKYQSFVLSRSRKVYDNIGRWVFGQFILMILVFGAYYALLFSLGVPNAFVLALLGGLLEIIPFFGPIASAVPAIILAFLVSPWTAVAVLIGYIVIQQVENHILVPQIMKRAVGVNPIVVILSLFIGAKIAGIIGMILAVPFAMGILVFLKGVKDEKQKTHIDTESEEL
jgi:predicted PurR-regulated permease PerM